MRRQVAMTWFRYERTAVIVAASVVLLVGLIVSVSSWRKVAETDAVVNMVTALTTNMAGRVIIHVDIELGGKDER